MMKKLCLIVMTISFLFTTFSLRAQEYKSFTRKGNKAYEDKKYNDAEILYRKALAGDSSFYKAQYNIGDALYKEKQYKEAARYYTKAIENPEIDNITKGKAFYNLGNSHLQSGLENKGNPDAMKNFQDAISSYQNALKLNSKDADAKYNLSYAKKMLQQAQQNNQQNNNQQDKQNQQDQQNQNKQNNQDQQNKDQNNQDNQNQQNKDQDDQQNKDRQNKNSQQNGQKEQKKQDAERILDAVKNNEKKTLDKQKVKVTGGKVEKDW